jgi:hypothetical protein
MKEVTTFPQLETMTTKWLKLSKALYKRKQKQIGGDSPEYLCLYT